jgi:hypothetical protein
MASEWQDITTAPTDRVIVLRLDSPGEPIMTAGHWRESLGCWCRDDGGTGFTVGCRPTHWMPLPYEPDAVEP